ncbi:MAG: pyridoxal 5'-phosphate synthase glutaminase subunit PdxT [Calditrichaeota bacterium]|nr:pyridoxal 5'-phosphate synthase glutaminase subunit PdxT [Calditrichota bacterium]
MTSVGILALQGDFVLHRRALEALGAEVVEVRKIEHLEGLSGLIIPGGESTTMHLQLAESPLGAELKARIASGLPTWGTCAGAILLGKGDGPPQPRWGLIEAEVARNAYGRQVDSFVAPLAIAGFDRPFDGIFIRAPKFLKIGREVSILAEYQNEPVMLRRKNLLVTSFHPELTDDHRVHRLFQSYCA